MQGITGSVPPTLSGAALRLHLSYLRASALVGQALASACPTSESWLALLQEPEAQETLDRFAGFAAGLRASLDPGAVVDFQELEQVGADHYHAGIEAVEALAERLGIEPYPLLITLLYG